MQLSAPIYVLKRRAKELARRTNARRHHALDQVAQDEGFQSWSQLSASAQHTDHVTQMLATFAPGDLILLGARPGQGKTVLALSLAERAASGGQPSFFFTLDYHERDVATHLGRRGSPVTVDTSDDISARYIIARLAELKEPAFIVVDYLQLLDQKRTHPALTTQVQELRAFVKASGSICLFLSQIDRAFELNDHAMPGASDVRLPNPLDLLLFDRHIFLHAGTIDMRRAA